MDRKRIDNAVNVIKYALENNISIKSACLKCGYSDTYVKNVKRILNDQYTDGLINDNDFNYFNNAYENYLKIKNKKDFINLKKENNISNIEIPITDNEQLKFDVKDNEGELTWTSGKNYPKGHIKTLNELLKACDVDLNKWSVDSYTVNKWDVTSWKKDNPETIQNYQVKARLLKKLKTFYNEDVVEIFKNLIKDYNPPILNFDNVKNEKEINNTENNLLEISIQDLHYGKMCWIGETGENYDTKIARERFLNAITTLIKRANGFEFSQILFLVGSDFFNSDNLDNTTTKGTQQDEDLRWQKTFKTGIHLVVDGINLLKQLNVPIKIIVIPGNHDFSKSYYLGSFLEAWFNNDSQICIDNGASPRKYHVFGKVLLGFTHGSEEKMDSLPLIMASDKESKKYWSDTIFHEWHLGHFHHKKNFNYTVLDKGKTLNEDLGVTVRYLSSLTGTEEWHHKKGFIGNIKAADAFIWNDELGMIAHLTSNINI